MTKTYRISNRISGQDLGAYEADSELGALDAMADEAGYRDYSTMCKVLGMDESDAIAEFSIVEQ